MVVDPSGRFAYVTNAGFGNASNNVSGYTINATSGALTPISGSPFSAGLAPISVAVDPSGRFAYVASNYDFDVSGYTINATSGALTGIPGSPFPAGLNPYSEAVDPSGKFVYVVNAISKNLSGYTIDSASGALKPIPGSPFSVGTVPRSVAVTGCSTRPAITGASATPASLWPPNHKMVDVFVDYDVTAPCGEPRTCALGVASNEPVKNDHSSHDWIVLDEHHLELRAERWGNGTGRIYTITIGCSDTRGNSATRHTAVAVAHDQAP
jgi:hypothetical protein